MKKHQEQAIRIANLNSDLLNFLTPYFETMSIAEVNSVLLSAQRLLNEEELKQERQQ